MNLRRRVGAAQHILLRVYVIAIVQIERGTQRDREREEPKNSFTIISCWISD